MASKRIWINKLALSAMIVDKEGQLIGSFSKLLNRKKAGFLKPAKVTESSDFEDSLQTCYEIYSFLRFNKILDHEEEIGKERIEKLHHIMNKYIGDKDAVVFDDLKYAYEILLQAISVAGYHNDTFESDAGGFEDEEY